MRPLLLFDLFDSFKNKARNRTPGFLFLGVNSGLFRFGQPHIQAFRPNDGAGLLFYLATPPSERPISYTIKPAARAASASQMPLKSNKCAGRCKIIVSKNWKSYHTTTRHATAQTKPNQTCISEAIARQSMHLNSSQSVQTMTQSLCRMASVMQRTSANIVTKKATWSAAPPPNKRVPYNVRTCDMHVTVAIERFHDVLSSNTRVVYVHRRAFLQQRAHDVDARGSS